MSVLVDTSMWVLFLNGNQSDEMNRFQELIISDQVSICPTIVQELLQGTSSDHQFKVLKNRLIVLRQLDCDPYLAAEGAADLYRNLRKVGKTIRKSNDCLIAWYGLHFQIPIWHRDRDFDHIAQYFPLNIFQ